MNPISQAVKEIHERTKSMDSYGVHRHLVYSIIGWLTVDKSKIEKDLLNNIKLWAEEYEKELLARKNLNKG